MKKLKKIIKKTAKKAVKKAVKKVVKKTIKKVVKAGAKKVSKPKVQDAKYWANRPLNDKDRDWKTTGENWIEDYILSTDHPHRQLIVDALKELPIPVGILEMGCNAGPNLMNLRAEFPETQLAGFDVSEQAIEKAKEFLPNVILKVGDLRNIPFEDKSFDVGIADASLMYISPKEINQALDEIDRVIRKTLVIVERVSEKEENNGYIWSRNYPKLLEKRGYQVKTIKLDENTWPHSRGWQEKGFVIVARLQS